MHPNACKPTVSSADQLKQYFDPPKCNPIHSNSSKTKAVWNGQKFDTKPFSRFNPPTNFIPTNDCREAYTKPIAPTGSISIRLSDSPNVRKIASSVDERI
uniref:AlNc14C223G9155 protein n=1 Tax=Albugo laibachii Nc14 TaxID=890382 RepID=F0WS13_9STRA|nr:AlNc14C223G9155 [Albugo laibachii Nc14]|eukprot:CCA24131.1 AlNc14C223G9155 [Albugo laibachii Nc14]